MTRPVDAVPLLATGRHIPSDRCPCRPLQAEDLLEPRTLVRIHRRMPDVPDVPPNDALLWRSREAMGRAGASDGSRSAAQMTRAPLSTPITRAGHDLHR
jgi:hypothetical protein